MWSGSSYLLSVNISIFFSMLARSLLRLRPLRVFGELDRFRLRLFLPLFESESESCEVVSLRG